MSRLIDTNGVLDYEEEHAKINESLPQRDHKPSTLFQKETFEEKITAKLEHLVEVRLAPNGQTWYVMLNFPERLGQGLALGVKNQSEGNVVATQIRKTLKDIIQECAS